ncbi:MAG TPA: TonB family protein [Pyrinomonadaceae bacterium]|nr:TonB family protein [Pyrinomonadaceae bacterium]
MKHLLILLIALSSFAYTITAQTNAPVAEGASGSREQDGLKGPVRRVRVETANVVTRNGKQVELPKSVIQVSTYDVTGRKIDSVAYPVEGATAPGKEEYKYDDKGNITEMTLRGADGSVLAQEKYSYELDEFGNWKKMTTAIAIYENGTVSYEPTQVTYRTLTYYYGPATLKSSVAAAPATAPSTQHTDAEAAPVENKPAPTQSPAVVSTPTTNIAEKPAPVTPTSTEANATKEDAKLPVLRISEEVLRNAAVVLPEPQYPAEAELARASGPVQVELIIDQNGVVTTARATSGNPMLFDAATSAARKARFLMSAFSDHPTGAYSVLTYNFARPVEVASIPANATTDARMEKSASAENKAAPVPVSESPKPVPVAAPVSNNNPGTTDTNTFAGYFNKGIASLGSGKYKEAVQSLTQAVAVNPQDAIAHAKLGVAYSALGEHKPAIAEFKQAIKLNRAFVDADSYFRLGVDYLALSDYASAIDPLKQALYGVKAKVLEDRTKSTAGPDEAEINDALGRAYYGIGSYRQAVKAFETAVRLKPNLASSHFGLGLSYMEVGDKRSAEKAEQTLRKLNSRLADRLAGMLIVPAGQKNKVF